MFVANIDSLWIQNAGPVLDALAAAHPYGDWLGNMVDLEPLIGPGPEPRAVSGDALVRRQIAAGFSREDLDLTLDPLIRDGKEAVGSMGDDAPPAVLSAQARPLAHYFRQNFSQVTNPPIDSLRERQVMSLKTRFGNLTNILDQGDGRDRVLVLEDTVELQCAARDHVPLRTRAGVVGAVLLLVLPAGAFETIVPVLIVLGLVLLGWWFTHRRQIAGEHARPPDRVERQTGRGGDPVGHHAVERTHAEFADQDAPDEVRLAVGRAGQHRAEEVSAGGVVVRARPVLR